MASISAKKITLLFICFITFFTTANSQTFLEILTQPKKLDSLAIKKNDTYYSIEGQGEIKMRNGEIKTGIVMIPVTPNIRTQSEISFIPDGTMKPLDFNKNEVEYCKVYDTYFYPVKIKEDETKIGSSPTLFLQRLNNSNDDKFKMYYFRYIDATNFANQITYSLRHHFYIMLPSFEKAHNVEDLTFMPFAKNMSKYLEDCPELSKKIKDKEEGYKINMLSIKKNSDDVYLRVMEEYNKCGK